jgi:hypothetical protein
MKERRGSPFISAVVAATMVVGAVEGVVTGPPVFGANAGSLNLTTEVVGTRVPELPKRPAKKFVKSR